jgi:hypothetical protein
MYRGLGQRRGLAELAGDVAVVAVAEAELYVVAEVGFVRAVDAVDQSGFLERGLGGGPAGPCPQIGVGDALPLLPDGERGEQDAGLVVVEEGGAGGVGQGAALRLGENVGSGYDGPGSGRDAPQRQQASWSAVSGPWRWPAQSARCGRRLAGPGRRRRRRWAGGGSSAAARAREPGSAGWMSRRRVRVADQVGVDAEQVAKFPCPQPGVAQPLRHSFEHSRIVEANLRRGSLLHPQPTTPNALGCSYRLACFL